MRDLSGFLDADKPAEKKPEINIMMYGYSPILTCFAQLKDIWNMIGDNYRIVKDYLILPDNLYEQVCDYYENNKDKFPLPWYEYPNTICGGKSYILKPFRGVFPESCGELPNGDVTEDELQKLSKYEQQVFAHKLMANPIMSYKKPIIMGTASAIQEISTLMGMGDEVLAAQDCQATPPGFVKEDYIWLELDEDHENILGEYKWENS